MFAFFSLRNASINLSIDFLLLEFSYNHACDISLTNDQFSKKWKLTKILTKKNDNWKNDILYVNKHIYISSKKLRNALFKQDHDDFYTEHFEYEKILELIRRKYWWFNLIRNVKKYFKCCIGCHWVKFTKQKFYDSLEYLSMLKDFCQDWNLNFIIDFFLCRFLNEIYDTILIIVNRSTKYVIYISICKDWKIKNLANAMTNNVFKYFDMLVSIVNNKKSLFRIFDLSYVIIFRWRYDIISFFIFKRINK